MVQSNLTRYNHTKTYLTALGLAFGPAIALGLARFAYALVLPDMKSALSWSFTTAGIMNTLNALGYLFGAILASPIDRKLGGRKAFIYATSITTASILATPISANLLLLSLFRLIAGVAGAITFITGAGLASELGRRKSPTHSAVILGIYFSGGGIGIALSGIAIPNLVGSLPAASAWRWSWIILGILALCGLLACIPAAIASAELPAVPIGNDNWAKSKLKATISSYALFGVGYIAYMTFIIAYLKNQGAHSLELSSFWVVLGVSAILASFTWSKPLELLNGGKGIALVMGVLAIGSMLPLISNQPLFVFSSAVIFGGTFLSVVTAVTTVARKTLLPHHWTSAIAVLTISFAIGQSLGPVMAGALSNGPTGVRLGLELSTVVLALGALVSLAQPHREPVSE